MNKLTKRIRRHLISYVLMPLLKNQLVRGLLYDATKSNTLLLADCGQEKYVVNSSDKVIGRYCYTAQKSFDVKKISKALALLPDASSRRTLVDVGGNIGTISIYALINNLVDSCIIFEPEPNNFRLLKTNLILNGVEDRVVAHNLALSDDSACNLEFELSESNFGDHRVRKTKADGRDGEKYRKIIKVQARKLDDFIKDFDLSSLFIWMDTQGFEGFVLNGAKSIVSQSVPMVTEFWPYGMERVDSYELFVEVITSGSYSTVIDLDNPKEKIECSKETFALLKETLGSEGKFTDLLIF